VTDRPASVLVVDDEKLIRWSIGSRLERRGYKVSTAETGEDALLKVASERPDLMLLDVRLPGIDGVTTLARALEIHPEMIVVMMSAHSTVDTAVGAMKLGATDFLVKPFPLETLDATVERVFAAAQTRRQLAKESTPAHSDSDVINSIVGLSQAAGELRTMVARLAGSEATTVLVEGESGVGKEVVSRAIHMASSRAARPFSQVNCAALPNHLLESELFGHERGAFTDAHMQKRGLVESADGGSVMLDEIGELPPTGQAKLLQLLESNTFRRVGGVQELRADVRIIAATNVNLERMVTGGHFRADLFFRLNVVRITVPPLRERPEDIAPLITHFLGRFNQNLKREVRDVAPAAMDLLKNYDWPGNVRQLRNVIERALILHPLIKELRAEHLPPELRQKTRTDPALIAVPADGMSLQATEIKMLREALERSAGNQSKAARLLGVSRDTLRYRLKKYELG
jgi:two-component system, NtrC family, response regulator AtoC